MTSDSEVVLASMNCHGGRDAEGVPFDLTAAIHSLAADVITLQECWHPDAGPGTYDAIAAELGGRAIRTDVLVGTELRRLNISREDARGGWGLVMITKLPVAAQEVVRLGQPPTDPTPRVGQVVTLTLPGGDRLRVVNTHLTYLLTSPLQLARLVHKGLRGDLPTVIAGDLNMPLPVTGLAVGYRPVVLGKTYPAHRPLLQLDHVLVSARVAGSDGEVLPPTGSDHLPVRARLRLP